MVKKANQLKVVALIIGLSTTMVSCSVSPQPLKLGVDNCAFCQMTVSNVRFGAEILTKKGKALKYDDISCMVSDMKQKNIPESEINTIYSVDFCGDHQLIDVKTSFFFMSENLKSPMGANVASFYNKDSMNYYLGTYADEVVAWTDIVK